MRRYTFDIMNSIPISFDNYTDNRRLALTGLVQDLAGEVLGAVATAAGRRVWYQLLYRLRLRHTLSAQRHRRYIGDAVLRS